MAALGGKQTLAFVQQGRVEPNIFVTRRYLEAPAGGQPKGGSYRWQDFIQMREMDRLEEVVSGRKLLPSPYIPTGGVSLRRMAKSIDWSLLQRRQSNAELQMWLARLELCSEAFT